MSPPSEFASEATVLRNDPFVVVGLGQVLLILEAVAFLDLIIDQGSDVSRYDLKERKRPLSNLPGLTVRSAG